MLQVRAITMSAGLARDMAAWSNLSQEALISAAMSCGDEADFRARVANIRKADDRR